MAKVDKQRSELVDRKYRPLKKLMKKSSQVIAASVADKQLPSSLVMADFMAQAKVMVAYPGFGDEDYAVFTAACEALNKAYKDRDLAHFTECLAVVFTLKKECHRRYK